MTSAVFTVEHKEMISETSIADAINTFRNKLPKDKSFEQYISSAASDKAPITHLQVFLLSLSDSKPACFIKLPDSIDNLSDRLTELAWDKQVTIRTRLRSHWSLLLEMVASEAPDLEIWTIIVKILRASDSLTAVPATDSVDTTTPTISESMVESLKNDWTSTFIPDSLEALERVIRNFDNQDKAERDKFYARTLIFIQSSGMGKSRLADAFGKSCPMISYVFREKNALGYPPADNEILSLMRMKPSDEQEWALTTSPNKSLEPKNYATKRMDTTWYHSLAVGLLQASFETLNAWVENQPTQASLGDLAALIHKTMAHDSGSNGPLNHRPRSRIEFCESVAKRAEKIADDLVKKPSWRRVFNVEEDSAIRIKLTEKKEIHLEGLLVAAQNLLRNLQPTNGYPPLVIVFDEASSLLKTKEFGQIQSGRYIALNRIMSCLKELRIWFFIISTESQVGTILPPNNARRDGNYTEDPSARLVDESGTQLKRIPPFLALRLDIQDRRIMQKSTGIQGELSKSLLDFGEPSHMAMFGRRLWFAYTDDPEEMNRVARLKLIGGAQRRTYDPSDMNHVLAALSFRLSLDPCLHNTKAIPLIRTAVNSHMRVVISIDEETGTMHTITPSEPILAKAAMEYLIRGNWSTSIDTLVRKLLEEGLVEKGLKGELYARLLLTLTHDCVRFRQGQDSSPEFMKSFTVKDFLRALYVEKCHESIKKVDERILEARMNFTHFVPTRKNLYPEVLPDLLFELLRRSAALQLAPNQPTYDILLPIYFGKEDEPLDPSNLGCVMIQVKNRDNATTIVSLFKEKFTSVDTRKASKPKKAKVPIRKGPNFVFNKMTNPILFLLFDFGITKTVRAPTIEVSYSSNDKISPCVWAIHSRGHDNEVFRCINLMKCSNMSDTFFASTVLGVSEHDILAGRNELFSELPMDFRYSPVEDEGDAPPVEDEGDAPPVEDEGDAPPVEDEGGVPPVGGEGGVPPVEDEGNEPPTKRPRGRPRKERY